MYKKYGISTTVTMLDGAFAFVLYDMNKQEVYVGRDPYGVRPLYMATIPPDNSNIFAYSYIFSSEVKQIDQEIVNAKIVSFSPGHYLKLSKNPVWEYDLLIKYIHNHILTYIL